VERSDRLDLTSLSLWNRFDGRLEEPIEMDPRRVDLSPLRIFGKLQVLSIKIPYSVEVTPTVIRDIPIYWPQLHQLEISQHLSCSRPPSIDHTHILELSQRLPNLRRLGIQFDASSVTSQEATVGSLSKLEALSVGRSPISSPVGVILFLRSNFPQLQTLETDYIARPKDDGLFRARWAAVLTGWNEARAQP
jgi:hypothetical protein